MSNLIIQGERINLFFLHSREEWGGDVKGTVKEKWKGVSAETWWIYIWIFVLRNWVFATNSNFLILISVQPDGFPTLIFQTEIFWPNRIESLKYLRATTLGCKDIGIRKSEFVAKTQFLLIRIYHLLIEKYSWKYYRCRLKIFVFLFFKTIKQCLDKSDQEPRLATLQGLNGFRKVLWIDVYFSVF